MIIISFSLFILISYTVIAKNQSFSTYMECCDKECQCQKVQVSINKNSFYFICILFWKPYEKEHKIIQVPQET